MLIIYSAQIKIEDTTTSTGIKSDVRMKNLSVLI